jgi:fluoroquinolone transport system permease protein
MAVSIPITAVSLPLSGIVDLGLGELLLTAVAAAPLAPLFALLLGSFAANKVQGFALSKASGVLLMPPVIAYFAPGIWRVPLALAPTYWPARLLWALAAGEPGWPWLAAGLGYQALLLWLLLRRFRRAIQS